MDAASGEWVIYHPPKSVGFGHQSRIRDPRRAWPTTEQFLRDLTQFTHGRHVIELTCCAPETGVDAGVAKARAEAAREAFGQEDPRSYQAAPRWTLDPSQLEAAVHFALDDDKFSKQQIGPTWLHFAYEFSWTEFEQLPYRADGGDVRHRTSLLGIFLGGVAYSLRLFWSFQRRGIPIS